MDRPEILLHLGMHKAGSTSIQKSLSKYDDGTTRFARIGKKENHSLAFQTAFSQRPEVLMKLVRMGKSRDEIPEMQMRFKRQIAREATSPGKRVIFSGEGIPALEAKEVRKLIEFFQKREANLRIFSYIRDPISYASAAFQQKVKGHRVEFYVPRPEYKMRFAKFVTQHDKTEFVCFDKEAMPEGSVVQDFAARFGLDTSRIQEVRANERQSASATAILYFWNKEDFRSAECLFSNGARKDTRAMLAALFDDEFCLDPDYVESRLDKDDIEWMEALLDSPLNYPTSQTYSRCISSEADLETLRKLGTSKLESAVSAEGIALPAGANSTQMLNAFFDHCLNKRISNT